jgi:uncharacterized protein (UPF0297 family)
MEKYKMGNPLESIFWKVSIPIRGTQLFLVKKLMIKAAEAVLHNIQIDLIHYMSMESGRESLNNYKDLFVRAQNKMPWRANRFEASLNPTTNSTEDTRSTKRPRQNSPSPTKQTTPQAATKTESKKIAANPEPYLDKTQDMISNHPIIQQLRRDLDQLQGNHIDLTTHIKEVKEQQHVIQTQVLELASDVTEINKTLTGVVSELTTTKHTVAQLDKAIMNLTTKQETATMYAELRESTDKIKGLLKQLVGNLSSSQPSNLPMITTDTISITKRKGTEILDEMINEYLGQSREGSEGMIIEVQNQLSQLNHSEQPTNGSNEPLQPT